MDEATTDNTTPTTSSEEPHTAPVLAHVALPRISALVPVATLPSALW
jgi:hypothetical protein